MLTWYNQRWYSSSSYFTSPSRRARHARACALAACTNPGSGAHISRSLLSGTWLFDRARLAAAVGCWCSSRVRARSLHARAAVYPSIYVCFSSMSAAYPTFLIPLISCPVLSCPLTLPPLIIFLPSSPLLAMIFIIILTSA